MKPDEIRIISSGRGDHFKVLTLVASVARASAFTPRFPTEDLPPIVHSAIVTAEASTTGALRIIIKMLFDPDRGRRGLIVSACYGVAHITFPAHIFDVSFMREERAVSPAHIFGRE